MNPACGNLSFAPISACIAPDMARAECPTTFKVPSPPIARRSTLARRGFSLVELLIVIVLMSILAKMAITSAMPSNYEQLQATANIIAGELAYGRSLAVGNNSSYRFDIDVAGSRL